ATTFWKTDLLGVTSALTARATDNSGAQTVASAVRITTVLPPLHYLIAYGLTTNRECELCMNGQTGHTYSVLAFTNIALTNVAAWSNLGNMQGADSFLKFFDPSVT